MLQRSGHGSTTTARTETRLSPQRRRFALNWLKTGNGKQAAITAGYSPKTADAQAPRLLASVAVQRFLAGRFAKSEIEVDRVMGEVARQAFEDIPDPADLVDPKTGNYRPLHELTPEQRRCIASVEVMKRNLTAGDGQVYTVLKIKYWNIRAERIKALELLAKIMRMVNNVPTEAQQVSI